MNLRTKINVLANINALSCVKDAVVAYNATFAYVKVHTTAYLTAEIYYTRFMFVYKVDVSINPISHSMRRKQLYAMDKVTLITNEEDKDLIFNLFAKGYIGRFMILLIYPPNDSCRIFFVSCILIRELNKRNGKAKKMKAI